MAKYLIQGNYVGASAKGLLKEGGTNRRAAIESLVGSVGGSIESFYYAFGETDVLVIADLPDNVTAAALSLVVNAAGSVAVKVTVLLTTDDIDEAAKKTVSYRAPGQS